MNWAASHPATRRALIGMYKTEGFHRKKCRARELWTKEKKELFSNIFSLGERLLSCRLPLLFMGNEEGPCDRLPYWCLTRKFLTGKITFLRDVETAIRSGSKSRFGIMGFWQEWSHIEPVVFFFNKSIFDFWHITLLTLTNCGKIYIKYNFPFKSFYVYVEYSLK